MTLNDMQYPFFVLAVFGSFLVTSRSMRVRFWAFVLFCASNSCMLIWTATKGDSWGVFATNIVFMAASIIGVYKNRKRSNG